MSISTLRKLGVLLAASSVVALVVFFIFGVVRGNWHYDGGGSSGGALWAVYSVDLRVSGYYLIPIFLCGAFGTFCLLWPARKPPKLNQ